ncbi:hypothetical protein ACX93W_17960 [Paenibacillus sp. CAU 1782]
MSKKTELEKILNGVPVNELIEIIVQVAEKDDFFRNSLLLKYNKDTSSHQLLVIRRLIKSIVSKYTGREDFIPYRQTSSFATEMLDLLENTIQDNDDVLHSIEVALLVLEEGVAAFQYSDDSDGDIGMLVNGTLHHISELTSELGSEEATVQEAVFLRIIAESEKDIFDGWEDFQITMFHICAEFGNVDKFRKQLISVIEKQIGIQSAKEYAQYTVEALLGILYELTTKYGTKDEADRFLQEHLHFPSFRELAIQKNMNAGDFQHVIRLAQEGEQKDVHLPGLVSKWKSARYEAYKLLSLKKEQEILGKELLLNGNYSYYQDLEDLFAGDKEEFYRSILEGLKQENGWGSRNVYLKLISDKNDTEEMMNYVRRNPSVIEEYAPKLINLYAEEIERMYEAHILQAADASSNRKAYQKVCGKLKQFKKVIGKLAQEKIIEDLKTKYSNRPAFVDELSML